jgi:hypothetical protein
MRIGDDVRAALERLSNADAFEDAMASLAEQLSENVRAFRVLLRIKEPAALFGRMLRTGTTAGRLYGLAGLYLTDRHAFDSSVSHFVAPDASVETLLGGIQHHARASEILDRIRSGELPLAFAGTAHRARS